MNDFLETKIKVLIVSLGSISTIEFLSLFEGVISFFLQTTIGILTIIYLIKKIRQHHERQK